MLMAITCAVAAQLLGNPDWTVLTNDTITVERLTISYGIPGNKPTDCLATSGECRFTLRNDAGNSVGTEGAYSPLHANALSGWTFEIPIRVTFQYESAVTVSSLTRSGNTATVTTSGSHGLSTGDYVEITGATPTLFNGLFQITVTGATTFTFVAGGIGNYAIQSHQVQPRTMAVRSGFIGRQRRSSTAHSGIAFSAGPSSRTVSRPFSRMRAVATIPLSPATGTMAATRTYVKFRGKIDTIDPEPGENGARRVHVVAYDTMRDIIDADVRDVPLQVNVNEADAIGAVLDAIPEASQPFARSIDTGIDFMPYVLDDIGSGVKAGSVIADLARSTYGLVFVKGDGTFRYLSRNTRAATSSSGSLTNVRGIKAPSSLANVYNDIWTTVHPRTIDSTLVDLYVATGSPPYVPPNSELTISGSFRDPDDSRRLIGGTGILQPVASTDYMANDAEDGTGTDMTTSIQVSAGVAASRVTFTVRNPTATPVWLVNGAGATFLKVRGYGVYDNAPYDLRSFTGKANRPLRIDLPYQNNSTVGQQIADLHLSQRSSIAGQVDGVTFIANVSTAFTQQALAREPGDVITVSESMIGLSSVDATIHACAYEYSLGILTATFGLGPVVTISAPAAPTSLTATVTSDESVDLSWTPGQAGASTQVYRGDDLIGTAGIGQSSFPISGLTTATDYTFSVRHIYFGLTSTFSNQDSARPVITCTGGTITEPGDGYRYHTFTSSDTLVQDLPGHRDILGVGAGAGGGGAADWSGSGGGDTGGGGGGGGRVKVLFNELEPAGSHAIVIGAGGSPGLSGGSTGSDGNDTTYRGTVMVCNGGGAGAGGFSVAIGGGNGASGGGGAGTGGGGGGSADAPAGGFDYDLGNNGGSGGNNPGGACGGGGGGGAGGAGGNSSGLIGGAAGARSAVMFDGNTYAAGGVGGRGTSPAAGAANTGDGGGGAQTGTNGGDGFAGGSGKFVTRYRI